MNYKNTQFAVPVVLIFLLSAVTIFVGNGGIPSTFSWIMIGLLLVLAILFSSMTVEVSEQGVLWYFGPRFWRKAIDLKVVDSVNVAKASWYQGFGIRVTSTGWLYRVTGNQTVRLLLKDRTTISLGTNEPEKLVKAIQANLG